jgi:hypothetical protein
VGAQNRRAVAATQGDSRGPGYLVDFCGKFHSVPEDTYIFCCLWKIFFCKFSFKYRTLSFFGNLIDSLNKEIKLKSLTENVNTSVVSYVPRLIS